MIHRELEALGREVEATTKRIGGYLYRVAPIMDEATEKVIDYALTPLMVELRARDIMQIVIGASILAIPVGLTEEAWTLSTELALPNVVGLLGVSLFFLSTFIYYNFYRGNFRNHWLEFVKRLASTYGLTLLVVAGLLLLIGKLGMQDGGQVVFARLVLVSFPASMSAVVSDTIK